MDGYIFIGIGFLLIGGSAYGLIYEKQLNALFGKPNKTVNDITPEEILQHVKDDR